MGELHCSKNVTCRADSWCTRRLAGGGPARSSATFCALDVAVH